MVVENKPIIKQCSICKKSKASSDFHKQKNGQYGLRSQCKICWKVNYSKNRESILAKNREWSQRNGHRHSVLKQSWKLSNPGKVLANDVKLKILRSKRSGAFIQWLTREQISDIEKIYEQSKKLQLETNIQYRVDHIIPLNGKDVCGLHVPWNLQPITHLENMRKGNRVVSP